MKKTLGAHRKMLCPARAQGRHVGLLAARRLTVSSVSSVSRRFTMAPRSDFSKRKQKVGKKKLQPTNATSTRFKVASISLPQQSLGARTDGPVSSRQLSAAQLLAQLAHYSEPTRHDALRGLLELATDHPSSLLPHASLLLDRAAAAGEDGSKRVRLAAQALLRGVVGAIHAKGALPAHEKTLALRLQSLLAHPDPAVRADGLPLLPLLLEYCPSALRPPPRQLLSSLADLLNAGEQLSSHKRPLLLLQARIATIGAMRSLLRKQKQGDEDREALPSTSPSPFSLWAEPAAAFAAWRGSESVDLPFASLPPLPAAAREGLRHSGLRMLDATGLPPPPLSSLSSQWNLFPPLLVSCWLEAGVGSAEASSDGPTRLAALECAAAIGACCRDLWLHAFQTTPPTSHFPPQREDKAEVEEGLRATLLPLLMRHVAEHVPVRASASASKQEEEVSLLLAVLPLSPAATISPLPSRRSPVSDSSRLILTPPHTSHLTPQPSARTPHTSHLTPPT